MWKTSALQHVLRRGMAQPARRCANHHASRRSRSAVILQRRTYMDVHQRPSHSGMFKRDGAAVVPPKISSPPPQEQEAGSFSLYLLLFSRAAMAAGIIYGFTEYVCDITLCEGPSMSPTLQPAGEIVLIDKFTLRRHGVADGCRGTERMRAAMERQQAFVEKTGMEDFWHEKRISVSDLDPPTWGDVYQLLSTPLSVGDVVVVNHPSRKGTVCKRVVGLPGDTVLKPRSGLLIIPDGHVWLEGDNPVK